MKMNSFKIHSILICIKDLICISSSKLVILSDGKILDKPKLTPDLTRDQPAISPVSIKIKDNRDKYFQFVILFH